MRSHKNENINIKPSSHLIDSSPSRKIDHVLIVLDSHSLPKGELDEDYKHFINDADLENGGMSDPKARDAKLQSKTGIKCSETKLRKNSIKAPEKVFDFVSPNKPDRNLREENRLGGKSSWISVITPTMKKGLRKAVILCGNEDDFLETNHIALEPNMLTKGELDEDYQNFVNDADFADGGLSDPKVRDAKLEQPRKRSLGGLNLRYTSPKTEPEAGD